MSGCRGWRNPRWNGGASQYKNHYLLKLNRKEAIRRAGGKCEVCDRPAVETHHIDETKTNHEVGNLLAVCKRCHFDRHRGRRNHTSKYKREYGIGLVDIAKELGVSYSTAYRWLHLPCGNPDKVRIEEKILTSKNSS